jgi:hypothetical protein
LPEPEKSAPSNALSSPASHEGSGSTHQGVQPQDQEGAALLRDDPSAPVTTETLPNCDEAWMRGQRGEFIAVSFKSRIRELRARARAARKAYTGDYNAPCQYFADACEEAAFLFEKRLQRITEAK